MHNKVTNITSPIKSFTLIEVVIAMTLFTMLSVAGIVIWQDILKTYQRIQMEEYLYTETQALLERMARTVQISGIDYEEYYNFSVIRMGTLGENYGKYQQHFFNPGSGGPDSGYGAYCTDGLGGLVAYPDSGGCPSGYVPDTTTFDYDTGQHPYAGSGIPEEDNAVCEGDVTCTTTIDYHKTSALFLINREGTERTYFTLEGGAVPAVAMVKLKGSDSDTDGLIDTWTCEEAFNCTGGGELPLGKDLQTVDGLDNNDFFPISPKHLFIDELVFYISPIEDPFNGYAETSAGVFKNVQLQPKVILRIKTHFQLYDDNDNPVEFSDYAGLVGEAPSLEVETTVSSGNTAQVPSYRFP